MLFFPRFVKQFSVTSLNSAVNAIAVRQGFRGNGRVFVGCCTLNALEYNGPELLMISHVNNRFSAHLLDGHRTFVRRGK